MTKNNSKQFTFRISKIWEGSADNLDPRAEPVVIKAKTEAKARKKLAKPDMGREWVLTDVS